MYLKAKDYYKYVTDSRYNTNISSDYEDGTTASIAAELVASNQPSTSAPLRLTPAIEKGLKETAHLLASKLGTKAQPNCHGGEYGNSLSHLEQDHGRVCFKEYQQQGSSLSATHPI